MARFRVFRKDQPIGIQETLANNCNEYLPLILVTKKFRKFFYFILLQSGTHYHAE